MTIKCPPLYKYALILPLLISSQAQAALFVSTGQTGAQVQVDEAHTQNWEFTPGVDIDIEGAKFKMKRGPSTIDDVSFTLIEGIFADWNTATVISNVSLVAAPFTQKFEFYDFIASVTLQAGTTYTGILWSDAINTQSTAYFVKEGNGQLGLVDENGSVVTDPLLDGDGTPIPTVPEPIALALLSIGIAGIGFQRRFKKAQ